MNIRIVLLLVLVCHNAYCMDIPSSVTLTGIAMQSLQESLDAEETGSLSKPENMALDRAFIVATIFSETLNKECTRPSDTLIGLMAKAIVDDDIEVVQFMIKMGLDFNTITINDERPIFYASSMEMAELLQKAGADITIYNKNGNLLHNVLVKSYHPKLMLYYTLKGLSLSEKNSDGATPLDYFCENDYPDHQARGYLTAFLCAGIPEQEIVEKLQTIGTQLGIPVEKLNHWNSDHQHISNCPINNRKPSNGNKHITY